MTRPSRPSSARRSCRASVEAMEPRHLLSALGGAPEAPIAMLGTAPAIAAREADRLVMAIVAGNGQSAELGTPFAAPLVVSVTRPGGEPVMGAVSFEAPPAGASASVPASATVGPDGLASVAASAVGQAGTYTVIATFEGANPVQFTLSNRAGPLDVLRIDRLGYHARPTRIAMAVNLPLEPGQAEAVANYRLIGPGPDAAPGTRSGRPIRLRSARYDAEARTVILTPAQPLRLLGGRRYAVEIGDAVLPAGGSGVAATATFGAEAFVPTGELARALRPGRRPPRSYDVPGLLR